MIPFYLTHVLKPLNIPLLIQRLKEKVYEPLGEPEMQIFGSAEPVKFCDLDKDKMKPLAKGEKWGNIFDCAWISLSGKLDKSAKGKKVVLLADINGEGCVYDKAGNAIVGITCGSSVFDRELGQPIKRVVPFLNKSEGNETLEMYVDAANNDLFGRFQAQTGVKQACFASVNDLARDVYYDMCVLFDLLKELDGSSARYASIVGAFNEVLKTLSTDFSDEELNISREVLAKELSRTGGISPLNITAVGHAHLDLAWLWPLRETRRKFVRTVATQLNLIDRYDGYVFTISQPQLLKWLKEDDEKLYNRLKERIDDKRVELQGCSWVEFDTYMPSGESIVRQFLTGKNYVKTTLKKDMSILWLPDTFGYSYMLPQLALKSGVKNFITIKLSWSAYDKFPFSSFIWKGKDGSRLLAHIPPELTYNGSGNPKAVKTIERNNNETAVFDNALMLFGIGDGAGGPSAGHLENIKRMKDLQGLCPVQTARADSFFEKLEKKRDSLPVYSDELYVQNHQGTLTSVAKVKKSNRKIENKLRLAETLCSLAEIHCSVKYPKDLFEEIWQEALLYQFHDILPGSSIRRVYDECLQRYEILFARLDYVIENAAKALELGDEKYYNMSPYENCIWTEQGGKAIKRVYKANSNIFESVESGDILKISDDVMENGRLKISFNERGFISGCFDKRLCREFVAKNGEMNRLAVYSDLGDAWDMSIGGGRKDIFKLKEVKSSQNSFGVIRESTYTYGQSEIVQAIILEKDSSVPKFSTKIKFNEKEKMLRAEFDVSLHAKQVNCDMQFGSYARNIGMNSSLDFAKFEFCAHKFAEIFDNDVSFALFNDCKYGYGAGESSISLNLARTQEYPNDFYDLGEHEFSYGFLCAAREGASTAVEREAFAFNLPVQAMPFALPPLAFAQSDKENVIIESLKKAEDGEGYVLRIYENKGFSANCRVEFYLNVKKVFETMLTEENLDEKKLEQNTIDLKFLPNEVKSIRIIL